MLAQRGLTNLEYVNKYGQNGTVQNILNVGSL